MNPFSEDDRPQATHSALSSSPLGPHLPERAGVGREGRRTPRCSRDHAAARSGVSAPSSLVVVGGGGGGAPAAAVSGRGGSGGIGSGGGDNDIGFGVSIVHMLWCVRTCQLQHVAEQHVRHNHAYFYFWQGLCQTFFLAAKVPNFFLAAKTTFGSWHAGTRGIHTGFNIFGSEKRLWQNSAKNKSWHDLCTIFFSAFCTYTLSLTL